MDAPDQVAPGGAPAPRGFGRARSPDVCPHLRSLEGPWRVQHASRDHRCALLARDARLDTGYQRTYCLTPAYATCPINVPPADSASRRLVGTSPVMYERGVAAAAPVIRQAAEGSVRLLRGLIVVLVVLAAVALFIMTRGPGAPGPGESGIPGASAGIAGSGNPTRSPAPTARATAAPGSPAATERPTATATPRPTNAATTPVPGGLSGRTYTVKKGDTLSGIAQTFKTTVAVLRTINNLAADAVLRVGQVIKLP